MNNLEPRAKIGDVVIVSKYYVDPQNPYAASMDEVQEVRELTVKELCFYISGAFRCYETYEPQEINFYDEDILKNLTTNVSYE